MSEPRHGFLGTCHDVTGGLVGPRDHDHRQAERARHLDLGVGGASARILGHDDIDLLVAQERELVREVERSARLQDAQLRRLGGSVGLFDDAREVLQNAYFRMQRVGERLRHDQLRSAFEKSDELRRVQWPNRRQVGQATAVVLGFVVLAGGYLGLLDALWKPIVDAIL